MVARVRTANGQPHTQVFRPWFSNQV
jgi:hypothetical protein